MELSLGGKRGGNQPNQAYVVFFLYSVAIYIQTHLAIDICDPILYHNMYSGGCSCGGDMLEPCNCSSSSGNYYGHHHHHQSASLSMFYPEPYYSSSSSSSVDCTLSLGTPSTRSRTESEEHHDRGRQRAYASPFCSWDVLTASPPPPPPQRNGRSSTSGEGMFTRRCANCDTTSTPLWRNGPMGPKSLCNACGIRHKKEEKKAAAASMGGGGGGWVQVKEMGYDGEGDGGGIGAFMSWRLNVADGSSGFFS